MLNKMKKTIGILLAVCFLMSVTAAVISAVPSVVKEKKTAVVILQKEKVKIFKWPHHHHHHHHRHHHHHHHSKAIADIIDNNTT